MASATALVGRLPSLFSGLLGAGVLAQFPAFFQQYLQSLGGRLDQAELQEARVLAAAEHHGLTVEDYLTRFAEAPDPAIRDGGEIAASLLSDAEHLRQALSGLSEATAVERPFAFVEHLDPAILSATAERFGPALPLSFEGLVYGALGLLLGAGLAAGLWAGAPRLVRGLRGAASRLSFR
jgi:hypothetical protein